MLSLANSKVTEKQANRRFECHVVREREEQRLRGCGSREALCQGSFLKPVALKSR